MTQAKLDKTDYVSPETREAMDALAAFMKERFAKPEMFPVPDLLPELRQRMGGRDSVGGMKFPCVRHPLLFAVPYQANCNEMYNLQFKAKQSLINDLKAAGKYEAILFHVERPHRMEYFAEMRDELTDGQYWELLSWVWSDSENLWQYEGLVEELLNDDRPGREQMMTAGERKFLNALPEKFRVYRGHGEHNRDGFSWSLSAARATWFANRFTERDKSLAGAFRTSVVTGIVRRADVIAFIAGRGEYEIIVSPEEVSERRDQFERFPSRSDKRFPASQAVMRAGETAARAFMATKLGTRSDHGPGHWVNVFRLGRELTARTQVADALVVDLFAVLHDHCRVNEMNDPEHGRRAAAAAPGIVKASGAKLTAEQMKTLTFAIEHHTDGKGTLCPTVGCCWDADRLDLIRVGIVPKARLLNTVAAKAGILTL